MSVTMKVTGLSELTTGLKKMASLNTQKKALAQTGEQLVEDSIRRTSSTYTKGYSKGNTARHINGYSEDNGMSYRVAMETDYAAFLEFGTRYMSAEPVLKPATNAIQSKFISSITKTLGD